MRVLWVIGFCLAWATSLWAAQPGYVSDTFEITVRTGPGMDRKIFAMIQSGQALEVLDSQDDWTHIRLPSGREGWVLTRFVTTSEPVAVRLAELEDKYQQLLQRSGEPAKEIERLEKENQRLVSDLEKAREEIARAGARPAPGEKGQDPGAGLRSAYKRVSAHLAQERQRAIQMEKELAQFSRNNALKWFLAGGGVLFVGFLLGSISRKKRQRSSLL